MVGGFDFLKLIDEHILRDKFEVLGFGVPGVGFRVPPRPPYRLWGVKLRGLGIRSQGVEGLRLRNWGLGFGVSGLGLAIQGSGLRG